MREILFRAKAVMRPPEGMYRTNYKNGDWVYGLVSKTSEYGAEMTNTDGVSGIDVDKDTICEYTGRVDKNEKKIFEHDIVRIVTEDNAGNINGFTGVVASHDCAFELQNIEDGEIYEGLGYYDSSELEVIGNAIDNPELLEASNG